MKNISFLWQNLWDTGTLTYSSQHNNFPATNTRHRHHTQTYRSRYGAGSGWGYFLIEAAVNDRLDFEETVATPLVATLTPGAYDADTLAAHIEARLEVAGGSDYTVTYSDDTNKFTIVSDGAGGGGILSLLWNSGANKARSIAGTIGFDDSADDTGALTYAADNVRIHSEEWLKVNLGSAQAIQAFAFRKHNLSATATAKIQGHTADAWGTPDVDVTLSLSADLTIYFWTSAQSKQWWRHYINDVDNSDGYVEEGRIFLGGYFSPSVNCRRDYQDDWEDPSDIMESDGGQITSDEKTQFKRTSYILEYITDVDLATLESIWNNRGNKKDWFFTKDRDAASTTTRYVRFYRRIRIRHIQREELYRAYMTIEELR